MKYYRFCELVDVEGLASTAWIGDKTAQVGGWLFLSETNKLYVITSISPGKVEQAILDELGRLYIG